MKQNRAGRNFYEGKEKREAMRQIMEDFCEAMQRLQKKLAALRYQSGDKSGMYYNLKSRPKSDWCDEVDSVGSASARQASFTSSLYGCSISSSSSIVSSPRINCPDAIHRSRSRSVADFS